MNDTEAEVRRALDTYRSAVLARNVDTLMHLYDPDVRVFDTWGVWSHEGAAAWRVAVEGWFASLRTDKCRVAFDDVRVIAGPGASGFAAMSAVATYTAVSAQGEELRAMQNRISWVLKKSGHLLRIVHEHTSVPVGFEDVKGLLTRDARA